MTTIQEALAAAIDEAVLRATDGTVRLDDDALRRTANELILGERTFDEREVTVEFTGTGFAINLRPDTAVIPEDQRRPAPTTEEAYARLSEDRRLREGQLLEEALDDPDSLLWLRIPQPTYSPDTPYEELPERIIRQCCEGKSCGGTELYKARTQRTTTTGGVAYDYEYLRASNDEPAGICARTLEGLIDDLNDPTHWPNAQFPFWEYDRADCDFNGPA